MMEFQPKESGDMERYQQQLDTIFHVAAARLIAHGDRKNTDEINETALFEDRKPYGFVSEIDPSTLSLKLSRGEQIVSAELSFLERCVDVGRDVQDSTPDTVLLDIGSINRDDEFVTRSIFLERSIGDGIVSAMYEIEGEDYFCRYVLNDSDMTLLQSAIDSLEPAPEMEAYVLQGR